MVPRLATEGASFKGAFLYYCHDKGASTAARVAWTETVNMMTDCVEKAWKVMAYTAKSATQLKRAWGKKRAGDEIEKPVISYSLSWHPEQTPDKATMLEAAKSSIRHLKMEEHEAFIVAHTDEPQPHVHVVINRIHPLTGMAANLYYSQRKLQDWARKFQREEGTDYCPKREENYQKRKKDMKTRYGDPNIIEAWEQSDSGQSFKDALAAKGYELAQGRKRLVVVDPYGKTINPVRQLPDVRAEEFNVRLKSIDTKTLPTPEEVLLERAIAKQKTEQGNTLGQKQDEDSTSEINEVPAVEPDSEKRQRDYDDYVFEKLTQQGARHFQEWDAAQNSSRERIEQKRISLTEYFKLEERQTIIDDLQAKLDAPSLVPKFVRRLFGMDRKTTEKLTALKAKQGKAKERFDANMQAVEKDEAQTLQRLESRHAREQRELTNRLEKQRPTSQNSNLEKQSQITIDWHRNSPRL